MTHFILNEQEIKTALPPGMLLLDFIRYHVHLMGTKIGCREGDCGACTILSGEIKDGLLIYSSATSCLMAIGNAHGKHIVTVEGTNVTGLNAVQQAFAEEGATQCGFCTPGFIVSLVGYSIAENAPSAAKAIDAVNGNICRCTGYKSIERAAQKINEIVSERSKKDPLQYAVDNNIIPAYFTGIKKRLLKISEDKAPAEQGTKFLAGGTDLYVQQHESMPYQQISFLFDRKELKGISKKGNICTMGAATTVTDIAVSPIFSSSFPDLQKYIRLISSTQIRNMATVGGNFTNASPIGDLTIFFLALDAQLVLSNGSVKRTVALRNFYKGYKVLDKSADEFIETISFLLPEKKGFFNFEKVSKRTCLDIASVNSAIYLVMDNEVITAAAISAGGVGPVPAWLSGGSAFLSGKKVTTEVITALINVIQKEISPISDARGSEEYKRLLLSQLIKAHFIKLFPALPLQALIIPA